MSRFDELELASYIAMEDIIVRVNVNDLIKEKLPIQIFLFCYLIHEGRKYDCAEYLNSVSQFTLEEIETAISEGWLSMKEPDNFSLNNFVVTEKFITFVEKGEPENWIDSWFNLFPEGVKSGNYYVRTDKPGSLKKMRRFCVLHKDDGFTPEVIMNATKNYIEKMRLSGYAYMKLAPYFIEKDGVSMLAGECENYIYEQKQLKERIFNDHRFAESEI